MIPQTTIDTVKESVKITDYLLSKGIAPINSTGKQFVYRSPLTNERSGSFFVHPVLNVFNDFSSGEKGDNIRLVRLLEKLDFANAIQKLQSLDLNNIQQSALYTSPTYQLSAEQRKYEINDIKELQHRSLINYVEGRGIPYDIAYDYVREIHYTHKNKNYFGVGFQNDKGSWAIRSDKFKTWIGSAGITTVEVPVSTDINLFEGFFDFLSALVYFRAFGMSRTTIILNSNANLPQALDRLKRASMVFTYLDRDGKGNNGGLQAMERLRKEGCSIIDRSYLYDGYKDFNDYLRSL